MREILSVSIDKDLKKRINEASKLYAISKSEVVKRAKSGFLTDDDIFKEIS
jgi:metal-responsive CopG/Arc/MetJ family transcriptional regulator